MSHVLGCCWHGFGVTEVLKGDQHTPNPHIVCVHVQHACRCKMNLCASVAQFLVITRLIVFRYTTNAR